MNETVNAKYTKDGELILLSTYEAIEATIKSLQSLRFSWGLTKRENRLISKLIRVLEESLGDGTEPLDD